MYKIGSYEVPHIPLLKRVAKTGKPVIMSIGYASLEEADLAIKTLRDNGTKDLVVLHCTSTYTEAAEVGSMNLCNIHDISKRFEVISGFSENAGGIDTTVQAVLAGASVIEKHVIDGKKEDSPDSQFSIDPEQLEKLVQRIREVEKGLGQVNYGPANEKEVYNMKHMRQSLFVVKNMESGEEFSEKNVRIIRPGIGMPPKHFTEIIGKKASQNIERGTPLDWELIEK